MKNLLITAFLGCALLAGPVLAQTPAEDHAREVHKEHHKAKHHHHAHKAKHHDDAVHQ